MSRFFLLVPDLFPGDGVGNDVLGMAAALRTTGASVVEVCNRSHATVPSMSPEAFAKISPAADDVLIYHYAVEWPEGDALFNAFLGPRILRFHNVTPPELLRRWNRGIADFCERGRSRVKRLAPPFVLLSVSSANEAEFFTLGGRPGATRILPPFHRAEEISRLTPNENLMASVAAAGHPRLLYVGRISPHKNVAALISELNAALPLTAAQSAPPATAPSPWSWLTPLRGAPAQKGPVLYVVGSFASAFAAYNRTVRRAARLAGPLRVEFLQDLSEASIAALYRSCDLFVTASQHEGFCVPVIEALACGLPLLLPDVPVFHETAGIHARFFSRLSASEVGAAIEAGQSLKSKRSAAEFFTSHYSRSLLMARLQEAIAAAKTVRGEER